MLAMFWATLLSLMIPGTVPEARAAQAAYPTELPGSPPGTYMDPRAAADTLEALLRRDSLDQGANWRAALALVNVGKRIPDQVRDAARDSLYRVAVDYARRAVRIDSTDPHGQFALANALGRASLTQGGRRRLRDAEEIRNAAVRALAIDPAHDGAWHVLGRWHAEIRRLSGLERFFARTFLGGAIVNEASWDRAVEALERAVALRPEWIVHRLALAEIYADVGRYEEARQQLIALRALPPIDPMDPEYRHTAGRLLAEWKNKS